MKKKTIALQFHIGAMWRKKKGEERGAGEKRPNIHRSIFSKTEQKKKAYF